MKTSLRAFFQGFRREIPWQNRTQRALFHLCGGALSLSLTYGLYWASSPVFTDVPATLASLAWGLLIAVGIYGALLWGCRRMARGLPWARAQGQRLSPRFFAASLGLGLVLLSASFLAAYPGGVSYDVYNQWTQAKTGLYNSWHPVFHTWLMGLGLRLAGDYPRVVALQILSFCGAMAYLMAVLRAWGLPKGLLLGLQSLILACGMVNGGLMYLWKDNAMTTGALVLCAQSVQVYLSRGEWLRKGRNAAMMGLALAFTTLVRHNAVFYTLPLLLCLALGYGRPLKRLAPLAGALALALVLVQGPLYASLDIVHPHNTYEESIGLPMTVLMDARAKNPEALDQETRAFLEDLADEATFRAHYRPGDYNSIKFTYPREKINAVPPARLLAMAASTAGRDPRLALEAVNAVTDLVWDVTGKNEARIAVSNTGDLAEVSPGHSRWNRVGQALQAFLRGMMDFAPLAWLFENIGVQTALLLLAALWALYRKGTRALLLALPVLLYNLGTMLLLCGNDARFFQFTMAVALPSLLALCQGRPGPDTPAPVPITAEEA